MDKYDKKIAGLNRKKQKAKEKQAKLQKELEGLSKEDLIYKKGLQVGKIYASRSVYSWCGLILPFLAILSHILPFSNLMLGALIGGGLLSIIIASVAGFSEMIFEKEWQKYNQEQFRREVKETEAKLQGELHKDIYKAEEKQTLTVKTEEREEEKTEDLAK